VVTRAIAWELKHALKSRTLMYVDDIIGVGFAEDIEADLAEARRISVADEKTEQGLCLDVIGCTINLTDKRVFIAKKNFLKALHGYISTDTTKRINLKIARRLASYGSRCGRICRVMRPFSSALHRMTWGRTSSHAVFWLSEEAIIAIQCWGAMLCLVRFRETEFSRSIESFAPDTPTLLAEFDSSLGGSGVIWFVRSKGAEEVVWVSAIDLRFLQFGIDSSNQHLSEFIGAIIAVTGQVMLGWSARNIALRGASVTSRTWAIAERPRVNVKEATHIAGKESAKCDRLSRREGATNVSVADEAAELGVIGGAVLEVNGDESVMAVLRLCDSRTELGSELEFIDFWIRARGAIDAFLCEHQTTHPTSAH
jgi:hypothetical protein